jgi:hypothetical protein
LRRYGQQIRGRSGDPGSHEVRRFPSG